MWNVICCMVSSLILLIESEYTVFIVFRYHVITIWRPNCVNPSVFIVFRCLFRYPAILRSPCDSKISTSTNWVLSDRVSDIFIYIYIYIPPFSNSIVLGNYSNEKVVGSLYWSPYASLFL